MKKWDPNWTAEKVGGYHARRDNYWAGAKKACDDIGMSLPDKSKLQSLFRETTAEKKQLGITGASDRYFWSSSESGDYLAYFVGFIKDNMCYDGKDSGYVEVLCVGD